MKDDVKEKGKTIKDKAENMGSNFVDKAKDTVKDLYDSLMGSFEGAKDKSAEIG